MAALATSVVLGISGGSGMINWMLFVSAYIYAMGAY